RLLVAFLQMREYRRQLVIKKFIYPDFIFGCHMFLNGVTDACIPESQSFQQWKLQGSFEFVECAVYKGKMFFQILLNGAVSLSGGIADIDCAIQRKNLVEA